jgi:hypothetical protein
MKPQQLGRAFFGTGHPIIIILESLNPNYDPKSYLSESTRVIGLKISKKYFWTFRCPRISAIHVEKSYNQRLLTSQIHGQRGPRLPQPVPLDVMVHHQTAKALAL